MTDDESKARVAATPAQADGRPAVCLSCGGSKGGYEWVCRACTDIIGWQHLVYAWDARTPPVAAPPRPEVGQTWAYRGEEQEPLMRRHESGYGWMTREGIFWLDSSFADGTLTYVRGPAPATVDPVPVGSRWRDDESGKAFTITKQRQGVNHNYSALKWDHTSGEGWWETHLVPKDFTRIDTPGAPQAEAGPAALCEDCCEDTVTERTVPNLDWRKCEECWEVFDREVAKDYGLKRETRVTQPAPVPCKHGCGEMVAFGTRHMDGYGRWRCTPAVDAAEVARCRAAKEGL